MNRLLRQICNHLSNLLFPGCCPICNSEPYQDGFSYICKECEDSLSWIGDNGCKYCSIPMSGFSFNGLICSACRDNPPSFNGGKSLFLLDQNGKKIIHELKYLGVKDILKDIPNWMGRNPSFSEFLNDSIIIPVPLHRKRLSKRGFNQSFWIAQALKKELGQNVQIVEALERVKNTPTQTLFDLRQRKKNVKNAFRMKEHISISKDSKLILIDDVYTTGATLDECAKELKRKGFQKVNVATLGHG